METRGSSEEEGGEAAALLTKRRRIMSSVVELLKITSLLLTEGDVRTRRGF